MNYIKFLVNGANLVRAYHTFTYQKRKKKLNANQPKEFKFYDLDDKGLKKLAQSSWYIKSQCFDLNLI